MVVWVGPNGCDTRQRGVVLAEISRILKPGGKLYMAIGVGAPPFFVEAELEGEDAARCCTRIDELWDLPSQGFTVGRRFSGEDGASWCLMALPSTPADAPVEAVVDDALDEAESLCRAAANKAGLEILTATAASSSAASSVSVSGSGSGSGSGAGSLLEASSYTTSSGSGFGMSSSAGSEAGSVAAGKADAAGAAVEAESWLGGPDSDEEQAIEQVVVPKVTDDMLPNFHRWRRTFPELQLLVDNFEVIQEEAMKVSNS